MKKIVFGFLSIVAIECQNPRPAVLSSKFEVPSGTIIIGLITQSGIYMAADSRSAIRGANKHDVVAYFDSVNKIHRLKQFTVGISGPGALGTRLIDYVVEDYNRSHEEDTSVLTTLKHFVAWVKKEYPNSLYPESDYLELIGAGYVSGRPQVVGLMGNREAVYYAGAIASDSDIFRYGNVFQNSTYPLQKRFEEWISVWVLRSQKEFTVGGPISVVQIAESNKQNWIQNHFHSKYTSNAKLYEDIKNDRIAIHYTVPHGKDTVLDVLRH